MKKLTILLFAICCLSVAFGQDAKQKVAIFTPTGTLYDNALKEGIRELIGSELVNIGSYTIVERALLDQIMKEQKFSNSGAVDDREAAQIGRLAGAQKIVLTVVSMLGSRYNLSIKIVDVNKGETDKQKTKICNTVDELVDAVQPLTQEVVGVTSTISSSTPSSSGKTNGSVYNPDGIEMVYVEGIKGLGGVEGFYIGKYEVTQAQWEAVMGSNPSNFKGDRKPVELVSWNDVKTFISKLNLMTGRNYRLPTEKEWVYAAEEGNKNSTYEYSGSNSIDEVAWYGGNSGNTTHNVGTKKPNALGIYDMSGNVWEWCEDWYDSSQTRRVNRGGSWDSNAAYCRVSIRNNNTPTNRYYDLGFRLALSL